jgi:putative heme iron utilization protein
VTAARRQLEHDVIGETPAVPPAPLAPFVPARTLSAAEEARTLVSTHHVASLATLTEDGYPWASMVTYGAMGDGSPVLYVSTLAEHGRNLARDARASLVVASDARGGDPLDCGRVTLTGRVWRAEGEGASEARDAHLAALPAAALYAGFGDFAFWVLCVERVRWVGGYGRMDSTDAAAYVAASPDPVAPGAGHAIAHLNEDHGDALLLMAQRLGGYPDATSARCVRVDRYGVDLQLETPRGGAPTRVGFAEPITGSDGLRAATVELPRRARTARERA